MALRIDLLHEMAAERTQRSRDPLKLGFLALLLLAGIFVALHLSDIPRSGIRDFFEIVQGMSGVISLGIGEPDFVTPWHIREAAIYSLEKGRTGYTSNLGLPRLRQGIASLLERRYGLSYDHKTEVLVAVGVSEALDLAIRATINAGDEVLYHSPCYVSYNPSIRLAHGVPVPVETNVSDGFALKAKDLEAHLTTRSKALLLNFPTNPTGATLDPTEAEAIARICIERDLLLITDEIYCELRYDGLPHVTPATLPGMRERTIYLNGFSKAYAMTGFRIGYACAPAPLTEAMMRVHQYAMLCASITAQEAAIEAIEFGDPDVEAMRRDYELRRNFIVSAWRELGIPCLKPGGAFYVFPEVAVTGMSGREFALKLLEEERVAVVPGSAFGDAGNGHVRCSYATSLAKIKVAMEKIGGFLARHAPGLRPLP